MDRKSRKKARRITMLAIVTLSLAIAAFATRGDWSRLRDQQKVASSAEAERQAAEIKRAELAEKRARLETPAGQEAQARSLGYRRPGEEPLRTK